MISQRRLAAHFPSIRFSKPRELHVQYVYLILPAFSSLSVSDLILTNGMNLVSFSDESWVK